MVIGKHVGTIDPLVVTSSDQNHICKIEHCEYIFGMYLHK